MDKKRTIYFLSLLSIILVITACSTKPVVNVSGRVVDGSISVSNAIITIGGNTTYTNDSGYFSLNVKGYSYVELLIQKPGYYPKREKMYLEEFDINIGTINIVKKQDSAARVSGYVSITGTAASITQSIDDKIPLHIEENRGQPEYVEGEVLVKFKENLNMQNNIQNLNTKGTIMSLKNSKNIYKIKSDENLSTEELYDYYNNLDYIEIVSYNYIGYLMNTNPNDSKFHLQWHLKNINMSSAWNINTGSDSVTVAVIDTGYLPHSDLIENIDTRNDRDFIDKDSDAYDDDANRAKNITSHGTHVAGIIGAVGNNDRGVTGVNWNVNILPIRISENNKFTTEKLIDAIYYAVDKGASVINLSLAYTTDEYIYSRPYNFWLVEEALEYAYNSGVTVVAAAGNNEPNLNFVFYPASSNYTIAVGATDQNNDLCDFSNYGSELDILAPGINIYSTMYTNDYVYMTGTSMAAPQVSGVAALLVAQGIRNPYEIKDILTGTSTPLHDSRLGGVGLLNAANALSDTPGHGGFLDVKIFAAYLEGDTYYLLSNITGADHRGYYDLAYIEPYRDLQIIAWIDENKDNKINEGEFFGKTEPLYLYNNEHRDNIKINLTPFQPFQTMNLDKNTVGQLNLLLTTDSRVIK